MKDGGPDSNVTGYWLFEIKSFLSIVLLKFEDGSREAFHSHAFDAFSWLIKGHLKEFCGHMEDDGFRIDNINHYHPSLLPFVTLREDFHKVQSRGTSWVLSIRGPWNDEWEEFLPEQGERVTLTHGRRVKNKS